MSAEAANVILNAAKSSPRTETGGILIGYKYDQDVMVTHAIEVPPSHPRFDRYVRSSSQAEIFLERFLDAREPDDPAGYVGEWHSHPGAPGPSAMDRGAIRELATSVRGPVALVIVRRSYTPTFLAIVAIYQRGKTRAVKSVVRVQVHD